MENNKNTNVIAIVALIVSLVGIGLSLYVFTLTKQMTKYETEIQQTNMAVQKMNEAVGQLQAKVAQLENDTTATRQLVETLDVAEMKIMLSDHNKKIGELQNTLKRLYGLKR
jgi:uncharacterized protein HemX